MDPGISSEERIVRGAVALFISADERSKGVRRLPPEHFDRRVYRHMVDSCTAERDEVHELITSAGLTFRHSQNGKKKTHLDLESPKISLPLTVNVTELMAELLPDSPSWYNIGSSVTHSLYWGLRDVDGSRPGEAMALTPEGAGCGRGGRVRHLRLRADPRPLRKVLRPRSQRPPPAQHQAPRRD
jgi:hypothetical protein